MVATRQGTVEHVNRGGIKSSVIIVTVVCVAPAYLSQAKEKCTSSTRGRGLYMPPEGSFPMGFRTIGETVRLHRVPFAQRPQERTYGGGGIAPDVLRFTPPGRSFGDRRAVGVWGAEWTPLRRGSLQRAAASCDFLRPCTSRPRKKAVITIAIFLSRILAIGGQSIRSTYRPGGDGEIA